MFASCDEVFRSAAVPGRSNLRQGFTLGIASTPPGIPRFCARGRAHSVRLRLRRAGTSAFKRRCPLAAVTPVCDPCRFESGGKSSLSTQLGVGNGCSPKVNLFFQAQSWKRRVLQQSKLFAGWDEISQISRSALVPSSRRPRTSRRSEAKTEAPLRRDGGPAAASDAWLDARDRSHTARLPTFLRPGTGALRLLVASPRCAACKIPLQLHVAQGAKSFLSPLRCKNRTGLKSALLCLRPCRAAPKMSAAAGFQVAICRRRTGLGKIPRGGLGWGKNPVMIFFSWLRFEIMFLFYMANAPGTNRHATALAPVEPAYR